MAEANAAEARRQCVLASIYFAPGSTCSVLYLRRELPALAGIDASADQIRGDLSWLQELGFVSVRGDVGQITERGADVARGAAPWPGK